ncbi:Hypothetical predicted protein [Pelobates cultripes]|uniref:Uncharacterized protein n=1 Tax=Pelobates cultripes TaxID=61616 RepID=A0AAD1VSU2_PELCU|nr:Hypothetical predicted protein [Pelobates cultripes]
MHTLVNNPNLFNIQSLTNCGERVRHFRFFGRQFLFSVSGIQGSVTSGCDGLVRIRSGSRRVISSGKKSQVKRPSQIWRRGRFTSSLSDDFSHAHNAGIGILALLCKLVPSPLLVKYYCCRKDQKHHQTFQLYKMRELVTRTRFYNLYQQKHSRKITETCSTKKISHYTLCYQT